MVRCRKYTRKVAKSKVSNLVIWLIQVEIWSDVKCLVILPGLDILLYSRNKIAGINGKLEKSGPIQARTHKKKFSPPLFCYDTDVIIAL